MDKFIQETQKITGIHLNARQVKAFELYEQELLDWNEKFNLTAIRDVESIRTKHFLDSLTCLSELNNPRPERLVDIGTGAGFPGIPLKIALPELKLTLVESVGKKADFCRHIVERLNLSGTEVLNIRAEEMGKMGQYREQFDWAVARAVSSLPVLAEYLLPLVRVGGGVLAQKGESAHAEAQQAEKAIRILGGSLRKVNLVTLPGVADERYLVVIDKKAVTPVQYPRRAGLPAKKPL
jgi:16S rRNA (guanine527-N7)-methyltransferase